MEWNGMEWNGCIWGRQLGFHAARPCPADLLVCVLLSLTWAAPVSFSFKNPALPPSDPPQPTSQVGEAPRTTSVTFPTLRRRSVNIHGCPPASCSSAVMAAPMEQNAYDAKAYDEKMKEV
jgi:hypothetical protein